MEHLPRSVEAIVEEQVRRWLSMDRAEAPARRPLPVITISREYGAGGSELGRAVAARLDFACWDQELVHAIAESTGASERLLRSLDEHARNALEDMLDGILLGVEYTETEYLRELMRVVHTIANHGAAVIIGRGAGFMLRDKGVLRVRVICPLALRIEHLMLRHGWSAATARRQIERVDRDRASFNRHHYRRTGGDPYDYDVVINTAQLDLERAAGIVVAGYVAKFGRALEREMARALDSAA
jgi:cytidylate kinase